MEEVPCSSSTGATLYSKLDRQLDSENFTPLTLCAAIGKYVL